MMPCYSYSTSVRLKLCLGVAAFIQGDMRAAAQNLLAVPVSPTADATPALVLHAEEVALYGCLAAIATSSREALSDLFLKGASGGSAGTAKQHLEQVPALRAVVDDLIACRYSAALAGLVAMQPALACDPIAAPQASAVIGLVRRRCIIQYLQAYCAVDLTVMAPVFGMRCVCWGAVLFLPQRYNKNLVQRFGD